MWAGLSAAGRTGGPVGGGADGPGRGTSPDTIET